MLPRVAILLAGYNGEKYIHEQIFSLLNQSEVQVEIFIRVDGESLVFKNIIKNYAKVFNNIHYIKGDRESSSGMNFYKLILEKSIANFDYYALCDQDDIWLPKKIKTALISIESSKSEAYSSGFTAYNSDGSKKNYLLGNQTKYDYMFQSAGPGCTFVFNKKAFHFLRNYLEENKELLKVNAHDWLIYFILRLSNKKWYTGTETHLMYRQHSSNVAGINSGFFAKIRRLKLLFSGWYVDDLIKLHLFARSKNNLPNFKNPLLLRRTIIYSLVTYIYYHLYLRTIISIAKTKNIS